MAFPIVDLCERCSKAETCPVYAKIEEWKTTEQWGYPNAAIYSCYEFEED